MKKYNLSEIMHKAWSLYRKGKAAFAECLHRAWNSAKAAPVNAKRIEEAQQAAGVAEPVNTWAGWKAAGYMVEHGAKALFQAVLIHSSKGDGQTYRASFFGASQVKPLPHFQLAQTEARNAGLWLSVMLLESSPVLNAIHLIHEQINKAHRQN